MPTMLLTTCLTLQMYEYAALASWPQFGEYFTVLLEEETVAVAGHLACLTSLDNLAPFATHSLCST